MTDQEIMRSHPSVAWREPIAIRRLDDGLPRWGCRLCIARHGLRGRDVPQLPSDRHSVVAHIAAVHPLPRAL